MRNTSIRNEPTSGRWRKKTKQGSGRGRGWQSQDRRSLCCCKTEHESPIVRGLIQWVRSTVHVVYLFSRRVVSSRFGFRVLTLFFCFFMVMGWLNNTYNLYPWWGNKTWQGKRDVIAMGKIRREQGFRCCSVIILKWERGYNPYPGRKGVSLPWAWESWSWYAVRCSWVLGQWHMVFVCPCHAASPGLYDLKWNEMGIWRAGGEVPVDGWNTKDERERWKQFLSCRPSWMRLYTLQGRFSPADRFSLVILFAYYNGQEGLLVLFSFM